MFSVEFIDRISLQRGRPLKWLLTKCPRSTQETADSTLDNIDKITHFSPQLNNMVRYPVQIMERS